MGINADKMQDQLVTPPNCPKVYEDHAPVGADAFHTINPQGRRTKVVDDVMLTVCEQEGKIGRATRDPEWHSNGSSRRKTVCAT